MELTKENINLLLDCRKIIDNADTAKIESRKVYERTGGSGMQESFGRIKSLRDKALADLGFNSVDDFLAFNKKMCLKALEDCFPPLYGQCDDCSGRPERVCMTKGVPYVPRDKTPAYICFSNKTVDMTHQADWRYILARFILICGFVQKRDLDGKVRLICPADGHGYYFNDDFGRLPFDINWRENIVPTNNPA